MTRVKEAEVVDLTIISQTFPKMSGLQIQRQNILVRIDDIFNEGTELVVVEGMDGYGKTTLLAQFVKKHPNHAISIFIKPISRYLYAPEVLRYDLCNQINWILTKEEIEPEEVDDALLRNSLLKLSKRARLRKELFYFVVDGLDEIPEEDLEYREAILAMLPLGYRNFCFLFSCDSSKINKIFYNIPIKSFPLSGFVFDETVKYFRDFNNIDLHSLKEIYKVSKGIPGHLASIKRILLSGIDVQTLLEGLPDTLSGLFEMEWHKVDIENEKQINLLAILAHDRRKYSIEALANMLGIKVTTIQEVINSLGFVTIDSQTQEVAFISESYRKFAAKKLWHLKDKVIGNQIDYLLKNPESNDALIYLPDYLEQARRFDELIKYLTPEYFSKILERTQSLSLMQQKLNLAISAAQELHRNADLVQFSIQKSTIAELAGPGVLRSEIQARMALKDYTYAAALAQSAILKEDRLHLLAIIAKTKREHGLSTEPELIEQIRQLYSQIDYTILGEQAIDIASDLIYSNPDLAIELVEKATNTDTDENALDWAFAKLSIAALGTKREQTDTIENIKLRIKNPMARNFTTAASLLLGEYSATEVIAEVEKLDGVSDRLYLLRLWAVNNQERNDAASVVDYALKLAIRMTDYAPNASVLRELATPLPFIRDEARAKQLVGTFDSQKGAIERFGPTEDYVQLQLLLAQTEKKYDFEAARNRIIDVYLYINEIDELATKTECLAQLVASLKKIDPEMIFENKDGIHTLAQNDLKSNIEQLLDKTAEHYYATRGVIEALAKTRPEMAFEIAMNLNTEERRDMALIDLIESAIQEQINNCNLNFLKSVLDQIVDIELRDIALLRIIEKLFVASEKIESMITNILPFINLIKEIRDARKRCKACCLAYSFLVKCNANKYSVLASQLLQQLNEAWQAIDIGWQKVDIGFEIVGYLAACSLETARKYLELTEKYRSENLIDAQTVAWAYMACIRLAIRAYSGLLPKNLNTDDDMEHLKRLIYHIPSCGEQARLWAELALRYYINGRTEDCKRIVAEHVKPLLQSLPSDLGYRAETMIMVAPALYCAHRKITFEQISELPYPQRDEAYYKICEFILRKQPPSEPYETLLGQGYNITYEEIVDICEILKLIEADYIIYELIGSISDSVWRRKNSFSQQQKRDIANRLEEIIVSKLPNKRFIKHDGYKIAAQAKVARIWQTKQSVWTDLITAARKIPNVSDRVFVLCIIASSMPPKKTSERKQILEEAKKLIEEIPTIFDRVDRYEFLANMTWYIDPAMCRECLKLAMKSALESNNPEIYPAQRRIIDLAYKLDPDLASSLASLADDDPARNTIHKNIIRRIQILDLKKKILDQLASGKQLPLSSNSYYPKVAWMLLGSLNANRIETVHFDYTREFIQVAATLPLKQSYPILAWVVENAIRRFAKTDQARKYLRLIYQATLLGANVIEKLAIRSSKQLKRVTCHIVKSSNAESILIRPGNRENAIQFLKKWVEHNVRDYLKICDPFFGPNDLEVLKIICSANPNCHIKILTSRKHQFQENIQTPWEVAFRDYWRLMISDQDPPDTEIIIIGTESRGEFPIHDRWWLTNGSGIRMGTSFNSLGLHKSSEISILSEDEAEIREREIDQYVQRTKREHMGERILYTLFTL